jgi:tetratricopeptide (TPR) repeat protein
MKELHVQAGRWLARMGEDDAVVARHLELGGAHQEAAAYIEKAARRSLAANALAEAVELSERSLAFAEDKPTQFSRAQLLDEAWARLDARAAERDTAVRAMQDAVYDTASELRARGARLRYEDACGGGPDTSSGLELVRHDAKEAALVDEEARSAAALASRYAFAGELDKAEEVSASLLELSERFGMAQAAVDAWQTFAVVRQARGQVAAALDARRSAARAAAGAQLKTREATLTINVGFALTTVGARQEARQAIESGVQIAQAVGSPGTVRHGQMILLCWTATFGPDVAFDSLLAEPRRLADGAVQGTWVPHDRATLGVLFYRGAELLRDPRGSADQARTLLKLAAGGYRGTNMFDVLPVALGLWADAERRAGDPKRAYELAHEAAELLEGGAPSLLNEAPVFLSLHDASVELGKTEEAKRAIARGMPRLLTRLEGMANTHYARSFLTDVPANAGLLAAAESYGLVPGPIQDILSAITPS